MLPAEVTTPPLPGFYPPRLARLFSPAGPPSLLSVRVGDTQVVAVPGRYCVSYVLVGNEELVVVDVGSASDVPGLQRVADWLGKPIGLVILTHLHFDHVMGADLACRRLDAPLSMSAVAARHADEGRSLRTLVRWGMPLFWKTWVWQGMPPLSRWDIPYGFDFGFPWSRNRFRSPRLPGFADGDPLPHVDGWRALLTPGHSDDGMCLYHEDAGMLIAGDTVRNFTGGEWNPLLTDRDDYLATAERLGSMRAQVIFPGHGPIVRGQNVLADLGPLD